jgi:hypothetical protein
MFGSYFYIFGIREKFEQQNKTWFLSKGLEKKTSRNSKIFPDHDSSARPMTTYLQRFLQALKQTFTPTRCGGRKNIFPENLMPET